MKVIKNGLFALFLVVPGFALAEGGGDIVFERMSRASEAAMQNSAFNKGTNTPDTIDFEHGMKLDIKKIIETSPPSKGCGTVPAQITYEDSAGNRQTIRYVQPGSCERTNG